MTFYRCFKCDAHSVNMWCLFLLSCRYISRSHDISHDFKIYFHLYLSSEYQPLNHGLYLNKRPRTTRERERKNGRIWTRICKCLFYLNPDCGTAIFCESVLFHLECMCRKFSNNVNEQLRSKTIERECKNMGSVNVSLWVRDK